MPARCVYDLFLDRLSTFVGAFRRHESTQVSTIAYLEGVVLFSLEIRHYVGLLCLDDDTAGDTALAVPTHTRIHSSVVLGERGGGGKEYSLKGFSRVHFGVCCLMHSHLQAAVLLTEAVCFVVLLLWLPETKGLSVNRIVSQWVTEKR